MRRSIYLVRSAPAKSVPFLQTGTDKLTEKAVRDTTSTSKPRTAEHLPDFLERFAGSKRKKKLGQANPAKGSPHTLVIAGAGLRAADLVRALQKYRTKDALVAKLFAKHIKLKESIETVKKARISIGVGTPQRIIDLLEDGALKAEGLERIVVDASHIDVKKRGMLDMKETLVPLVELLTRKEFRERYESGEKGLEVLFF